MKILDKGFVEIVDIMGDDYLVLKAARTSTGSEAIKGVAKDRGLIRYLYRKGHHSPFEFPTIIWHVKCPVFIARQIFRHRNFSFSELSARYRQIEWETYMPMDWRLQDKENKQSSVSGGPDNLRGFSIDKVYRSYYQAQMSYESLIDKGIAREQARVVAPMGIYTEFLVRTDLRNLLHFLNLRMDAHAQEEMQELAEAMYYLLKDTKRFAWTMEIFDEVRGVDTVVDSLVNQYKNNLGTLRDRLKEIADE